MLGPDDTGPEAPTLEETPPASSPAPAAPAEIAGSFDCLTCGFRGKSAHSLRIHISRSHGGDVVPSKPKRKAAKYSKPKKAAAAAPPLAKKLLREWSPSDVALALREMARELESKAADYRSVADHLEAGDKAVRS